MHNVRDLKEKRKDEKRKYLNLLKERPSYGSTNHGKNALGFITEYLKNYERGTIVDFGCGANNFLLSFRNKHNCIGIDFVNPGADLIESMHETSLPNNIADITTSFDALEHLIPEEVDEVLEEMRRVSKPNKPFVFSISHKPSRITSLGKNLHPTVETRKWWIDKLMNYSYDVNNSNYYITGVFKK